jgi:ankyrin repeat protein
MVACALPRTFKAVRALLEGGADPCYQTSDGATALHLAASRGLTDTCRALHAASSGRVLELAGKADGLGITPLLSACAAEQFAVVKLLCTLGAHVNHSDAAGNTPVMVATAESEDRVILQFLLQQDGIKVNQRNKDGFTALIMAAEAGHVAAVRLLLSHGADVGLADKEGFTPVFAAAARGHLRVQNELIQHGVDLTVTAELDFTLLMQAARSNQPHVTEFLIEKGASVHTVDGLGATALQDAALSTSISTETMRVLLAHGADVNASNHEGETPLRAAAHSG